MAIDYVRILCTCATVSATITVLLLAKSIVSFTQTGPEIRDEIRRHYAYYTVFALARLSLFAFVFLLWMALLGTVPGLAIAALAQEPPSTALLVLSALAGIGAITALQFCKHLVLIPSSIMMNSNYSMQRFIGLHRALSVSGLRWLELTAIVVLSIAAVEVITHVGNATSGPRTQTQFIALCLALAAPYLINILPWPGVLFPRRFDGQQRMNVLMIGSDTLRADHVGARHKQQPLTPFIDTLAAHGALFSNCLTSIARTAPSLVSIFTGTWPNTNGIKTNYIAADKTNLAQPGLGKILADNGYVTATITDWSGSDLNKFPLGFQQYDGPQDQWNIKFLIRQGPKDIRLFLSLFTHNRVGKVLLPEIYYLAGKPMTKPLGQLARAWLRRFAAGERPFFLNLFLSTTHSPFGSEHPYYQYFTDPGYRGESAFGMSRLTDPVEIIRSQKEPREAFDLDQVMDLYKGCVRNFDDEVRKLVQHLRKSGLDRNTIVVIYGDHGMEFFENNTWGQGNSIHGHASNRIPLRIIDPREQRQFATDRLVRAIDIVPTILEKLGIAAPNGIDGVSLQPMIDGEYFPDLPGFCETGLWLATPPGQHPEHIRYPELLDVLDVPCKRSGTLALKDEFKEVVEAARDSMVEFGEWRLIRMALNDTPAYELYHLPSDPDCAINRAADKPDILARLADMMLTCTRPGAATPVNA
jgi:arylsulfatase A-like enzyme